MTGRLPGFDPAKATPQITAVLEAQAKRWGSPLAPYLLYARRPSLFRGVRGMWGALEESGLLDTALIALLNRRVAGLNGCEF